jgi:hypothetical protein
MLRETREEVQALDTDDKGERIFFCQICCKDIDGNTLCSKKIPICLEVCRSKSEQVVDYALRFELLLIPLFKLVLSLSLPPHLEHYIHHQLPAILYL